MDQRLEVIINKFIKIYGGTPDDNHPSAKLLWDALQINVMLYLENPAKFEPILVALMDKFDAALGLLELSERTPEILHTKLNQILTKLIGTYGGPPDSKEFPSAYNFWNKLNALLASGGSREKEIITLIDEYEAATAFSIFN